MLRQPTTLPTARQAFIKGQPTEDLKPSNSQVGAASAWPEPPTSQPFRHVATTAESRTHQQQADVLGTASAAGVATSLKLELQDWNLPTAIVQVSLLTSCCADVEQMLLLFLPHA